MVMRLYGLWSSVVLILLVALVACRGPATYPTPIATATVTGASPAPTPMSGSTPAAVPRTGARETVRATPVSRETPATSPAPAASPAPAPVGATGPTQAVATPLADGCRAPLPVPPEPEPGDPGDRIGHLRGCLRITIPPGDTYWFDANQGHAACAGALLAVTWVVVAPDEAEVVLRSGHQEVFDEVGRGSRGVAGGYCGAVLIDNPNTASVTLDLAYDFAFVQVAPENPTATP